MLLNWRSIVARLLLALVLGTMAFGGTACVPLEPQATEGHGEDPDGCWPPMPPFCR